MKTVEAIHDKHASHFDNDIVDEERIKISNSWFDETTADHWRHIRAYECADCLKSLPEASWLTVGDGRFGLDSIRLRKKGFSRVLATDISPALLTAAKERGLIDDFAVENAEKLSFADESFDFAFCKEAFHHFPRPYLALYEMLRVARQGVFMVEPCDTLNVSLQPAPIAPSLREVLRAVKAFLTRRPRMVEVRPPLSGFSFNEPSWETSGNFQYGIQRREAEKVALGLNLPQIVMKGLNDHYVKGCEFEPADPGKSAIFREIFEMVKEKDRLYQAGLAECNLLMVGFMKKPLSDQARAAFVERGWDVKDLPSNPYI